MQDTCHAKVMCPAKAVAVTTVQSPAVCGPARLHSNHSSAVPLTPDQRIHWRHIKMFQTGLMLVWCRGRLPLEQS